MGTRTTLRRIALLGLLPSVLATGACSMGGSPDPDPTSKQTSSAPPSGGDGSDVATVLDLAFTGIDNLGKGHGLLEPALGNTMAAAPPEVLSVTFAFTCTGQATATLKVTVDGRDVPSATGTQPCDKSIFQRSVDIAKSSSVSYQASITGPTDGSFAYGYYTEKKQLPQ